VLVRRTRHSAVSVADAKAFRSSARFLGRESAECQSNTRAGMEKSFAISAGKAIAVRRRAQAQRVGGDRLWQDPWRKARGLAHGIVGSTALANKIA
jgi:hypothetical protein